MKIFADTVYKQGKLSKAKDVLLEANRQSNNDGWVQRGKSTGDFAVTWWIADKLCTEGYLEKSPDGFAYRITTSGKQRLIQLQSL